MNHSSSVPGNHKHAGKHDAFIVPESRFNDLSYELTVLDQEIPSFELKPKQPVNPKVPSASLSSQTEQNRSHLPLYSTGGASGFLVQKPPKTTPAVPVPPAINSLTASSESIPDPTRTHSLRHEKTVPLPHMPSDAEAHIPVGDIPPPVPPVILKNDLSTYSKQSPVRMPEVAHHPRLPVSGSPSPSSRPALPPTATPLQPGSNILLVPIGTDVDFTRSESEIGDGTAVGIYDENRQTDHSAITPDLPADTEVHIPVIDMVPLAPPVILKNYPATYPKRPSTFMPAGKPNVVHHTRLPESEASAPHESAPLSHAGARDLPADTEVHFPVVDMLTPAPPVVPADDPSTHPEHTPAAATAKMPDTAQPEQLPELDATQLPDAATLPHANAPDLPADTEVHFHVTDMLTPPSPVVLADDPSTHPEHTPAAATAKIPDTALHEQLPELDATQSPDAATLSNAFAPELPADTGEHFHVVDLHPPASPAARNNEPSTHRDQTPAVTTSRMAETAHPDQIPELNAPAPFDSTALSHAFTPDQPRVETAPVGIGSSNNPDSFKSAVKPTVSPIDNSAFVSSEINNPELLDSALKKLIQTIPLLSEDELLGSLAEPQNGGFMISLKTLNQALVRIGLETDYKRYRAYITG